MQTFDELVAQLRGAEGAGFDVSATQAGIALNRWIKRLAALSKWVREERDLGPSVVGQDLYEVDGDIVEIHDIYVGGAETQRKSALDIFRLKNGTDQLVNGPPWIVFAEREDAAGTKQFQLWPAPDSVVPIIGFCSVTPIDLNGSAVPPFPEDYVETLLHGAMSTLYATLDENAEKADYYEQKFLAAAEALRRRGNARVGSGAWRIPVYGRDF